ncbi:DUF5984 family protein [Deinococcus radiomollis]|uniref:DUF5984 family protein n=1 Tax=Deinococcus radiomollis TaxID=468916 RepID=UPI003891545C
MPPLFGFRLRPLSEIVQGWRAADYDVQNYLKGWFWLTYGWYWIVTPDGDVPLNNLEFNAAFALPQDLDPHLDYQVARLWIDLEEMLPNILEPLPAELASAMASGAWETWWSALQVWWEKLPDDAGNAESRWDAWYLAISWWASRHLDMGYLKAPPVFRFWRVGDTVTLSWDTREKRVEGALCWVETQGQTTLPVGEFLAEVEDFRARLDTAMQGRLREVEALGLLDAAARASLEKQHHLTLHTEARPAEPTDWNVVLSAIQTLEAGSGMLLGREELRR